jgi:hypothetical protein
MPLLAGAGQLLEPVPEGPEEIQGAEAEGDAGARVESPEAEGPTEYPAGVWLLRERAFSTDDLETEFGQLVQGCGGYKPTPQMALGFLRHLDFMCHVRRN